MFELYLSAVVSACLFIAGMLLVVSVCESYDCIPKPIKVFDDAFHSVFDEVYNLGNKKKVWFIVVLKLITSVLLWPLTGLYLVYKIIQSYAPKVV